MEQDITIVLLVSMFWWWKRSQEHCKHPKFIFIRFYCLTRRKLFQHQIKS